MYISSQIYPNEVNAWNILQKQEKITDLSLFCKANGRRVEPVGMKVERNEKPIFWVCDSHEPLATFPLTQNRRLVCGNSKMRLVGWNNDRE
jgi:hypothetical protein